MESKKQQIHENPTKIIDNSYSPFNYSISEKSKINILEYKRKFDPLLEHPHKTQIEKFILPEYWKIIKPQINLTKCDKTAIFINNETSLNLLSQKLSKSLEFAVDLEHHSKESYQGFTCLLQITVNLEDYIIDPFPIWNLIGKYLKPAFENEKIMKVFHGADNDLLWLQRDFNIFVFNIFDTHKVFF